MRNIIEEACPYEPSKVQEETGTRNFAPNSIKSVVPKVAPIIDADARQREIAETRKAPVVALAIIEVN